MKYVPLIGRLFLVLMFLMTALMDITQFSGMQQYMASMGMPLTTLFLIGAILLKLAGGLSVLVGYKARLGAVLLLVFIVPTTLIFHTNFADQNQMVHFMKNLSMLGGLMMVVFSGAGPFSLDDRKKAAGREEPPA